MTAPRGLAHRPIAGSARALLAGALASLALAGHAVRAAEASATAAPSGRLAPELRLAQANARDDGGTRIQTPLQALLEQARRSLARGQPQAAHDALAAALDRYAGDPDFDYLLGLAALDLHRPGEAILAFERVLAVEPGHLQARAEIARAYAMANEREAARREFETVAAQDIPAEVRQQIDRYLAALAAAPAGTGRAIEGWMELGLGYDSNVNFGSAIGQWLLADGTAVTPLAQSLPQRSPFASLAAGLAARVPIGGAWHWTSGLSFSARSNPGAHTLDLDSIDLSTGLERKAACHDIAMLAQYQHLTLDASSFRDAWGALGQWRCNLDARTQAGVYLQAFEFRFPDQSVRDAARRTAGLTLARVLDGSGGLIALASAFAGHESPRQDVPQLEFRFTGLRVALDARLHDGWRGFASLAWETRDFAAAEPLFGATRHDRQTELRIGAERMLDARWSLVPQIVYTRNASTLAPNDFVRTQAMLVGRYRLRP